MTRLFKVIARRTSYEYAEVEAYDEIDAIAKVNAGDEEFDWKDLPELDWEIDTVQEMA